MKPITPMAHNNIMIRKTIIVTPDSFADRLLSPARIKAVTIKKHAITITAVLHSLSSITLPFLIRHSTSHKAQADPKKCHHQKYNAEYNCSYHHFTSLCFRFPVPCASSQQSITSAINSQAIIQSIIRVPFLTSGHTQV